MHFEGEFLYLCLFSFMFIMFVLCVVLFVISLTQRKLLNSFITLGTMLILSVGVRIGFVLAKKFQNFQKFRVAFMKSVQTPLLGVRTPFENFEDSKNMLSAT